MIQVSNVVKEFDGFRALDGVNMHVGKGEIYGLVGPNGAGKLCATGGFGGSSGGF